MVVRDYCGAADLEAMVDLLSSARSAQSISDYPTPLDLRELLALPEMQIATRLWFSDAGDLVAFALVDTVNNLLFELNPNAYTVEIEDQLVTWGMDCVSRNPFPDLFSPHLDATCKMDNVVRKAFLERHGFERSPGGSLTMVRSLDDPIPVARLPYGFIIRPMAGEQEVEAYVALHQAAFGTRNMTKAYRLAIMQTPDYLPELDLVAVAPDGSLAALCVCQMASDENGPEGVSIGRTDPVGTHPAYRRRGLAKALLLTGLSLLKERGATQAELTTTGDNLPMIRAAGEAGFTISSSILWFSKPVQPTGKNRSITVE